MTKIVNIKYHSITCTFLKKEIRIKVDPYSKTTITNKGYTQTKQKFTVLLKKVLPISMGYYQDANTTKLWKSMSRVPI